MAKLPDQVSLPKPRNDWERLLVKTLTDYLNTNSQLVNGMSGGRLAAHINADSAAPTSGLYAKGDIVPKLTPAQVSGGASYLQIGWICVSDGSASAASFADYIILSDNTGSLETGGGTIRIIDGFDAQLVSIHENFLTLQTGETYATWQNDDYVVEAASSGPITVLALQNGDTYATMSGADLAEG